MPAHWHSLRMHSSIDADGVVLSRKDSNNRDVKLEGWKGYQGSFGADHDAVAGTTFNSKAQNIGARSNPAVPSPHALLHYLRMH